ncbi:hypothetical protein ABNX05_17090 [Lysinibacillus sp. M3]|uniref:Uncharacterized protein n=1 Tax=Lysinibacillus zambalensis TaxID=3160866 RepID=A0ABV1MV27_9BACI
MKNKYVQIEIIEDVTHKLFTGIGFIIKGDEREYESGSRMFNFFQQVCS